MALEGTGEDEGTDGTDLVALLVAKLAEQNELLADRDAKLAAREAKLAEQSAQITEQSAQITELVSERDRLRRAYEQLKEELLLVKRRLFIAKAERVDTTQLELEFAELSKQLDALAGAVPEEDDGADDEAPTTKRKRKRTGRRNLADADLPETTIEVPDESLRAAGRRRQGRTHRHRDELQARLRARRLSEDHHAAGQIPDDRRAGVSRRSRPRRCRRSSCAGAWPRLRRSRTWRRRSSVTACRCIASKTSARATACASTAGP